MSSPQSQKKSACIKTWFLENRRPLPWRKETSPYYIWVSEVMLQQTQAKVVIPYFKKWMEVFPTIETLAEAPLEKVLKLWEGLGYYSRAKNLHLGAQFICTHFKGVIPKEAHLLNEIKGLGPYTIGAIRSFAFKERSAAVDGNVIRVLSRLFAISGEVSKRETQKTLWKLAESLLPENESHLVSEGLIELGALICKKKPLCNLCPLNHECAAYLHHTPTDFPHKKKGKKITQLYKSIALIQNNEAFLVKQIEEGTIMSGLTEFYSFEAENLSIKKFQDTIQNELDIPLTFHQSLLETSHSYTRYKAHLTPYHFFTTSQKLTPGYHWKTINQLKQMPFSSGHRRIWESLCASFT
ncbi:A/G-specific adenine glycosylase [Chlamydiales bacterium]|nr:A/G-specific adenine glycosylase [Chlamydiales bacterium]